MATIESLKKQLMSQQDDLIQQLETIYINFIMKLLQQKKQIIQKMQQLFHKRIERLYTLQSHDIQTSELDPAFISQLLTTLLDPKKNDHDIPKKTKIETEQHHTVQYLGNQNRTKLHVRNIHPNDKKSKCTNININNKISADTKTIPIDRSRIVRNPFTKTITKTITNQSDTVNVNHYRNNNNINHNRNNNICGFNTNRFLNRRRIRIPNINNNNNYNAFGSLRVNNLNRKSNANPTKYKISTGTQTNPIHHSIINGYHGIGSNYASLTKLKSPENYKCKNCDKCYKHLCNLKTHQKVHTNNCYVCQFCNKRFGRKHNYTEHVRIHTGETPFECTMCRKRFKQKHGLKNHMKKLHQCNF
eukprot:376727_1